MPAPTDPWARRSLPPATVRKGLGWLLRAVGGLAVLLMAALLLGALVPENRGWREAEEGVVIHFDHSPVHSWLILPVAAAGHDWRSRVPALPGNPSRLAFSWGERDFFLATPRWADLDPAIALRALLGGNGSLVHLVPVRPGPAGAPIRLSHSEYLRLVRHLEAQIAQGDALPGYGKEDLFLPAHGRYAPWRTCNQWTRDALAVAGVRVGRWTPLPQGLAWRFPTARERGRKAWPEQ
ncbi:DUF2459 domain-containing protein [Thermaurantiacus sp.]